MTEVNEPTAQVQGAEKAGRGAFGRAVGMLAGANMIAAVLRLVGQLVIAALLLPRELGTLSGISLVLVYGTFVQVGVTNGLNRELPYFIGKGNRPHGETLAASALGWILGCATLAGLGLFAWAALNAIRGQWDLAAGWVAYGGVLSLLFMQQYLSSTFRTTSEFKKLAIIQVVQVTFGFLLLGCVWALGYYGQCIRLPIMGLFFVVLLWKWRPVRVRPSFNWRHLVHLAKVGVPIFGVGYLYVAWRNLDRALVVSQLGKEQLGFYQLSFLTYTAGNSIILALSQVLYPRMSQAYGKSSDPARVFRMGLKPTFLMAAAAAPLLIAAWAVMPHVVRWLLPNYTPGIAAARWTLLSIWLLCFMPSLNIYNVLRKQIYYAIVIGAGLGTFVGLLPYFRAVNADPLVPFAQAMAAGTAVFVLLGNIVGWRLARHCSRRMAGGP